MYVVTLFALNEYLKVSKVPHKLYIKAMMFALTSLQYALISQNAFTAFLCALPILCLWVVPLLVISCATIQQLELVTSVGVGLVLLVYYTSHIPALAVFPQLQLLPEESVFAIFILLLITWLNDVFQFIAGHVIGKRKIVPAISPNKTLGGFLGGIVGTSLLTLAVAPTLLHLSPLAALGLGAIISITGMFGDLFFSAIKRNVGVKDFSDALPDLLMRG
jgi:phosphatidate cytidylyltransferase